MQLHRLEHVPDGFLTASPASLHRVLPGPTLMHLPGERPGELFVSILQHGNEHTGLLALQELLADYEGRALPRPMTLFVANIEAARHGRRRLDHQADYNRAWPGTELAAGPETGLMAEVFSLMRERPLFASIDIHNTTGENPHYACVNALDDRCLQLAHRFGRTVVYFTRPRGAQAQAFSDLCPAVILECGRVGTAAGTRHARDFVEDCLALDDIPDQPPAPDDLELFASVAMVQVPDAVRFDFEWPAHPCDPTMDLCLPGDIDRLNFRELPEGTVLGRCRDREWPVRALDPAGREVTGDFFACDGGTLRLRRRLMPSLLTRDPRIVRQDCLCHLMQRMRAQGADAMDAEHSSGQNPVAIDRRKREA